MTKIPSTHSVEVGFEPEEAHKMPYAPAVRIVGAAISCSYPALPVTALSPSSHRGGTYSSARHRGADKGHGLRQTILDEVGGTWKTSLRSRNIDDMRDADG